MSTIYDATKKLGDEIGQGRIMTLATRNGDGVAARTVNVYSVGEDFYFITENNSNKYMQLTQNSTAALSVDAIQIKGKIYFLEHPNHISNQEIKNAVEKEKPGSFEKYKDDTDMRLLRLKPDHASFILLTNGKGFAIDYLLRDAKPVSRF